MEKERCVRCGNEFEKTRFWKIYCSAECRKNESMKKYWVKRIEKEKTMFNKKG